MPYRGANYSFTIDSSFRPFEMQELLTPYMMYKDAYEKQEQAYNELSDKSDMFRYLSDTLPKESKARQIYEGYANELNKQAEDLSKNGLSMNNRRALMNLKRRYQGEIGRLEAADTALQKERELRRQMNAKDGSMLYAVDNLDIDKFLDGNTPNLYNISGTELHTLGAAAGKAASSRVYSVGDEGSTLDGYYRKWVERNGYSKESMNAFRAKASDIPELQQAAKNILIERGVYDNLRENPQALRRAEQSVLNGIIDGAITQESVRLVRDEGKMSASAREQYALQREQMTKSAAQQGLRWDPATKFWKYDIDIDPNYQRQEAILKKKAELKVDDTGKNGSRSGSGGSSTERIPLLNRGVRVTWNSNTPNDTNGKADDDTTIKELNDDDVDRKGTPLSYDNLPTFVKNKVDAIIGDRGNVDHYVYYYKGFKQGMFDDAEASIEIVPRKIIIDKPVESDMDFFSDSNLTD